MAAGMKNGLITIEAAASKDYEPDRFRLQVDFEGDQDSRTECVEAYNSDCAKVKALLVEAGIPADEIRNGRFSVAVHYERLYEKVVLDNGREYYKYAKSVADGYEYFGDCSVESKVDFGLLASIWNGLQGLKGDFSFDITYMLERPDECEKELLRAAVAEARDRAETLADAAGSKLGRIDAIHYRFNNASKNRLDQHSCSLPDCLYDPAMPDIPDFNPEAINVRCDVTVAWVLE